MPITLNIHAESVKEFDELIARFSGLHVPSCPVMPEVAAQAAAPVKGRGKTKADTTVPAPTQNPDGTPIAPVHTPEPQPTPGGTDAPPAESIPPNQGNSAGAEVAQAATASEEQASATGAVATSETVSATPAASSPAADTASAEGEVTVQNLKDAMAQLLKAKSASFAMKTLEDATGCKSLTSGSPSVVEKAKDDPSIMRKTLDALVTAKDAA